ncbi:Antileukoproteinase, partial [Ophiophagus hannah]
MEYETLNLEHLRIVGCLDGQSHQGRIHFHLGHFNVFLKDVVFPQEIHFHALYLELIVAEMIMTALKPYVAVISDVAAVVESHQIPSNGFRGQYESAHHLSPGGSPSSLDGLPLSAAKSDLPTDHPNREKPGECPVNRCMCIGPQPNDCETDYGCEEKKKC